MGAAQRSQGLEDLAMAAGYLDRLALLLAVALTATGFLNPAIVLAAMVAPAAMVATALWRARTPRPFGYLAALAPMALVDLAVTLESIAAQAAAAPIRWRTGGKR